MRCALNHLVEYCSLLSELAQRSYFGINNWTSSSETKITFCPIQIFPNTKTNDTELQSVSLHYFKATLCIAVPDLNHCSAARPTVLEFQRRNHLIPRKTIPLTSLSQTSNLIICCRCVPYNVTISFSYGLKIDFEYNINFRKFIKSLTSGTKP